MAVDSASLCRASAAEPWSNNYKEHEGMEMEIGRRSSGYALRRIGIHRLCDVVMNFEDNRCFWSFRLAETSPWIIHRGWIALKITSLRHGQLFGGTRQASQRDVQLQPSCGPIHHFNSFSWKHSRTWTRSLPFEALNVKIFSRRTRLFIKNESG